jgi:hypothetical protein
MCTVRVWPWVSDESIDAVLLIILPHHTSIVMRLTASFKCRNIIVDYESVWSLDKMTFFLFETTKDSLSKGRNIRLFQRIRRVSFWFKNDVSLMNYHHHKSPREDALVMDQRWARLRFFEIWTEPKPKCVKPNRTGKKLFFKVLQK